MTVGEVVAQLKLDMTGFRSGIERANALLERSREVAARTGAVLGGFAAAAAGSLAVATQKSAEFEAAMRNVNSILKVSEAEFAALSESVLKLGGKTGQAPAVLARALYDIASSGFSGAEGLKILEASAIGATAGLTDTATAARAVTGVLNAYGMSADEVGRIQDLLFKGVERGVFSYGDLAQNLGEVVSTAALAKVPLEEVIAALAVITQAGVQPAEAFTSVNQALLSIISPSAEASTAAAALGIDLSAAALASKGFVGVMAEIGQKLNVSAADLAAMGDSAATDAEQMQALAKASGASVEQLSALFPNVRAFRAAALVAANGARGLTDELIAMQDSSGAAASAFAEQSKSFQVQWAKTKAGLDAFLVHIGSTFLPMMKAMASALALVVRAGEGIPGPLRTTAAVATALGAAIFGLAAALMLYQTHMRNSVVLTKEWMAAMAVATRLAKGQMATGTVVTLAGALVRPGDYSLLVQTAGGMQVVTGAAGRVGTAFRAAGASVKAFFAAIGPVGWIAIGVIAAAEAWMLYKNHVEQAAKAQREQTETTKKQAEALKKLVDQLGAVNAKIAEAEGKPGGAVPKDLLSERQRIANELSKQFPQLVKGYTATGQAILLAADAQGKFDDASQRALDLSKEAAKQSVYAAGQASNAAQARVAELQGYIESYQQAIEDFGAGRTKAVQPYQVETWRARIDALRAEQALAAQVARDAAAAEQTAMASQRRLLEWERQQSEQRSRLRKAAGAAALAEIDREVAAMHKAGLDAVTLEQYKQQRIWLEAKKWKDERVKLQIELLKAQGKTDDAAVLEAARAAKAEFDAAKDDANKRIDAEMKLQAALTEISVKAAATRSESIRAEAKAWLQEAQDLYKAGVLNAGEYIEQLNRIAAATGRIAEQQKKAGDPAWLGLLQQQADAQRAAVEELANVQEQLRDTEAKLHKERLQWTEEERQARASLYGHELKILDLTRAYALDQLKVTRQDSEYAQGQVNKEYLDALAKAKPAGGVTPETQHRLDMIELQLRRLVAFGLTPEQKATGQSTGEVAKALMEEQQRLRGTAVTPTPEELSAWAEKYRAAVIAAAEDHAISETEAVARLTEAKNAALEAERAATEQDRAKFEERRTQHEQTLKMLEDEQGKLEEYVGTATKATRGIFETLAGQLEGLRDAVKNAALEPARAAVAAASGWGRIATVGPGGNRVINFYYHGQKATPSATVAQLLEAAADELEREHENSRN